MSDAFQRHYRAPCPGCGAPVDFRSAQSVYAVCAYCQSTVVRQGETLSRLGKMAELFDDHSPLQLGASGHWNGKAFNLVGRLQFKGPAGVWTEWHVLQDDGTSAWLAEDNGAYVFARPLALQRTLPEPTRFRVGSTTAINGRSFSVAFNDQVALIAAQGELPHLPALGQPFAMVELRSQGDGDGGEVVGIDYGTSPAQLSSGREVRPEDLRMQGLRETSVKDEKGRQFGCPHCGAPVQVTLASSQSITCPACHSIIDLRSGLGGELAHALQNEPVRPLIALGRTGILQGVSWQIVGFQHRLGREPGDDDEEHFGWDEYLLYNTHRGFAFLVDAEDGWSVVRPTTGAPTLSANQNSATWRGTSYRLDTAYHAETTYVEGEFYWPVYRGQKTFNRDFSQARQLLAMEQTPAEVTWSAGTRIDSSAVAAAFRIDARKELLERRDVAPFSAARSWSVGTIIIALVIILLVLAVVSRCTRCDPRVENCSSSASGWRTSGGSFGGFSTGGGHK